MSLPDKSKLESLVRKTTAEKEQLGLPTSGYFWSSSEVGVYAVYGVIFDSGRTLNYHKYTSYITALCVGD